MDVLLQLDGLAVRRKGRRGAYKGEHRPGLRAELGSPLAGEGKVGVKWAVEDGAAGEIGYANSAPELSKGAALEWIAPVNRWLGGRGAKVPRGVAEDGSIFCVKKKVSVICFGQMEQLYCLPSFQTCGASCSIKSLKRTTRWYSRRRSTSM